MSRRALPPIRVHHGAAPCNAAIQAGAHADPAIIHPERTITVNFATMETNAGLSLRAGWDLAGFSRTTPSRGEGIVDDDRVAGHQGRGQWLPRASAGLASFPAQRPSALPAGSEG